MKTINKKFFLYKNNKSKKSKKKTIKNKKCIAVLKSDESIKNNSVNGVVNFIQKNNYLLIKYSIKNLSDGLHGFHIHKCGDLTKGCHSGCEHFNPFNKKHGSLNSNNSHAGDLGNIISINNIAEGIIKTNKISLNNNKKNIIGRMVIVHENIDDCGNGKNEESLITGNAGKRLACGIIGISN